ncbi:probable G-protein coupled receptor No18 [Asterias amurensis]|uniref:probable G-protein coupled receptor No18 n=1 Tax=Asterias amurensis TaxID=7602 RepID=UPI003AB5E6E7
MALPNTSMLDYVTLSTTMTTSSNMSVAMGDDDDNMTSSIPNMATDVPFETYRYILAATVAFLIFLVTVIPNMIIIILVVIDRKLRKLSNYYIISLATADCIVGALVMPCMASYTVLGYWALGGIICDLWIVFDFMCCTASMLSLCMISLDRYWAITQPLKHMGRISRKRALFFVACVWTISAVCWVPAIVVFRFVEGNFAQENECSYLTDPIYVLMSSICIYYIPMFALVFLYMKVYLAVKRQFRNIESLEDCKETKGDKYKGQVVDPDSTNGKSHRTCKRTDDPLELVSTHAYQNRGFSSGRSSETQTSHCDSTVETRAIDFDITTGQNGGLDNSTTRLRPLNDTVTSLSLCVATMNPDSTAVELKKLRLRKIRAKYAEINRRTARTLGIIVILFLICWLPFVVLFPINGFCECIPGKLYEASYWLAYLNSTLNPFLYGFSIDFRKAFRRLFCRKCISNIHEVSSFDDGILGENKT